MLPEAFDRDFRKLKQNHNEQAHLRGSGGPMIFPMIFPAHTKNRENQDKREDNALSFEPAKAPKRCCTVWPWR